MSSTEDFDQYGDPTEEPEPSDDDPPVPDTSPEDTDDFDSDLWEHTLKIARARAGAVHRKRAREDTR